jgi:hypothetical protein
MIMTENKKEKNNKRTSEDKEHYIEEVLQGKPEESDKITKILLAKPNETLSFKPLVGQNKPNDTSSSAKEKKSEDSNGAKE